MGTVGYIPYESFVSDVSADASQDVFSMGALSAEVVLAEGFRAPTLYCHDVSAERQSD